MKLMQRNGESRNSSLPKPVNAKSNYFYDKNKFMKKRKSKLNVNAKNLNSVETKRSNCNNNKLNRKPNK